MDNYSEEEKKINSQFQGDEKNPETGGHNFGKYDLNSSPDDYNTETLIYKLERGSIKIPRFQRNYVWDIKTASKLIESMIIGIPIPQMFLFRRFREKESLLIDGHQRYMTIYFFKKQRFPKKDKRIELREIFAKESVFSDTILNDDNYFTDFKLQLAEKRSQEGSNRLHGLTYKGLGLDDRGQFDGRTIRTVSIQQYYPEDDGGTAAYEIFNRLNGKSFELTSQEKRASLFDSPFYDKLYELNQLEDWRYFLPKSASYLRQKDVEILLRAFAMLDYKNYSPSMLKFLNVFSYKSTKFLQEEINSYEQLLRSFLAMLPPQEEHLFFGEGKRFNISVFEALFVASCTEAFEKKNYSIIKTITLEKVKALKENKDFVKATQANTTGKENVKIRIEIAISLLA